MFCQNCGAQLTGSFCTQCATRVGQNQSPIQSALATQPRSSAGTSRSGLKILLIVVAVIGFLSLGFADTLLYGWHKVKQAVASKGIDLSTIDDSGAGRHVDACQLLTKEELGQILNFTVERSEGTGPVIAKIASADMSLRCNAFVAVMQTAQLRDLDEPSDTRDLPRKWTLLVNNDCCKRPLALAFDRSSMSSAAVVQRVSKPFWMAR